MSGGLRPQVFPSFRAFSVHSYLLDNPCVSKRCVTLLYIKKLSILSFDHQLIFPSCTPPSPQESCLALSVNQDLLLKRNRRPTKSGLNNEQVYHFSEAEKVNSTFSKVKAPVSFSVILSRSRA
ncbi:hypothetical protein HJG60_010163 [Phyllostomus discolor]|uniref:Uncharacterized protein n=1 Tax=Phyllostomus discolor TaxID=89673 RepID=A0A834EMM5_9CHIR|nr:hypothetical protein HJG60_010163 [Phyllostomus discolor]